MQAVVRLRTFEKTPDGGKGNMSDELPKVDEYYKRQAKQLVDLLFDKGFLADDLSRDGMDWLRSCCLHSFAPLNSALDCFA